MGNAKIHRLADRVHRGQLFVGGGLFIAHLQRVVDVVEARGGDSVAVAAAWLHAAPAAGSGAVDLLRRGVPARVVDVVEVLQQRPSEYPPAFTDRLLRNRRAALIRYAVLQDWHDNLAGAGRYGHWRPQHERLADALNLPRPAGRSLPTAAEFDHLIGSRPAAGDHWGPIARTLQRLGDPRALPALLEAYYEVRGDDTRGCCLQAIRSAIFDIASDGRNVGAETVVDLTGRWWASADTWEELVAVRARAATADPARHRALLSKLETDRAGVAAAAIKGLAGDAERDEVESLRRVVTRPEPDWRWARQAAARRLLQIGGPDAQTALDQRYLNPADPPWRDEPDWLHRNRDQAIPLLIGKLGDRMWQFEACYALGELRAVEAVGSICLAAATVSFPVPHIEALGKIRSPDAVLTILDLTRHTHPEVRDHALRALDRIGDPRVIDAAIAACDDLHPVVRDRAARVLTRHGDTRAVTQLIRLCDGRHAAAAAAALSRIGDPRAPYPPSGTCSPTHPTVAPGTRPGVASPASTGPPNTRPSTTPGSAAPTCGCLATNQHGAVRL